ncbi:prepilin peptidase [Minwuia sp.]|uniref:prepilin peptidase n=1 Tax=Minwuia sp. TaxID=2493630 RepID=UPI003A8F7C71
MTDLPHLAAQWPAFGVGLGGVLGLMGGSFLNVVIGRLPPIALDETRSDEWPRVLITPGSRCPACGHAIRARHNIPLAGYLMLRGRCRDCGARISLRYPLIELAGGILGAAAVLAMGFTWAALGVGILLLALLALSAIDLDHQILPDQIVLPMLWTGLLFNAFSVLTSPADAIVGAAVGFGALTAIRSGYRALRGVEGMGRGDAKLAAMIGAWLGLDAVLTTLLLAFLAGTMVALAAIALKRMRTDQRMPFGPALAAGAFVAAMGISFY